MPAAGIGYVFNGDGTSCYGKAPNGDGQPADVGLQTDAGEGPGQTDHPVFPAVGLPAFGDLGGAQPSFVAPVAGLLRALDLVGPDYQVGSQDFTAAWDTSTGQFRPGFPTPQNDLSFLTGPIVGDLDGNAGEEVMAGTPRWTSRPSPPRARRPAAPGRSSPATGPWRRPPWARSERSTPSPARARRSSA